MEPNPRANYEDLANYTDYTDLAEYAGDLDYPPCGTYAQAYNAGTPLSGGAVTTAWRNAKRMIRQGYVFRPDGIFHWHGGCVTNPHGRCYDVYLPGAYPDYTEGKCTCAFFDRYAVCKHIYFAVHQFQVIQAAQALAAPANDAGKAKMGRATPAPHL